MISRVAVLPQPPLLVPELTVRSRPEAAELRAACLRAASALTEVSADWLALGTDRRVSGELSPRSAGSFAGFGVDVAVSLQDGAGRGGADEELPLPALIAGWLRERAGAAGVRMRLLDEDTSPAAARQVGVGLSNRSGDEPSGLLVLADGPRRFGEHEREGTPESAAELLRDGLAVPGSGKLDELDVDSARRSGVVGRAALQALSGLVGADDAAWRGELIHSAAPFGVGYHVAVWTRAEQPPR
ncbi:hypothetical protein [Actinopolyspora saharensis]|uniref:hypothetical protein n=1 Tax=Actinopolyspora saharensis TaxID=995062 RepID=UPI000B891B24|nr:hypothetical protein [Actinopolyspora saharensis]